ncbi:MAG: LLM class flavin-dependent oxidoreductase [Proteobacteria bacterium]|nr:LLM class flavin-dependent oxidoreductase [Pseudomonadota bacterium]
MTLIGFMQAQNCSNYIGSWRHPESVSDFLGPEYFQRIARTLEHGKFQLCFFDDRLAMPDILGNDHREAVQHGARVVKMDPVTILACMGMATKNIGLGSTYSTTYYQPFHVARVISTLDLMTSGRAAWNVVTSLNNSEAHNMGAESHMEHDARYDVADEFMEVVLGHWDTWEDDAIVVDKETGLFAHPDKVHRLDHKGKYFRSKGPFTVPRSAQGRPVVIQAGQSGRGQAFSARWGELVFWVLPNLEIGKRTYDNFKKMVAACGRDPASVAVAPAIYCVPGETKSMAEDKMALIDKMAKPVDGLELLSEALNFDFYSKPMDSSFTDAELEGVSGLRAIIDRVVALSGKRNPTIRDFVQFSSRGTVREFPRFVGTPKEIADELEQWFNTCCDGFVVAATHMPGSYEDFVRLVVPELQRRGLHQKDYKGSTLRANLGLPKAQMGDWKLKH